jgi:hypothetical protein
LFVFTYVAGFRVQYFRQAVDHLRLGQAAIYFEIQTFALVCLYTPATSSQRRSVVPLDGNSAVAGWKTGN